MGTQLIKTYEDACVKLNIAPALPDVSMLPEDEQQDVIAYYKLKIVIKALNDGWEPDWNNVNERKYFPWFEVKASKEAPSGSGLACDDYDCAGAGAAASVGSRLCFPTQELAQYAATQFIDLYSAYMKKILIFMEPRLIKTFEEACAKLNIAPALPDVSMLSEKHQKAAIAQYKIITWMQATWDSEFEFRFDADGYIPWFFIGNEWSGFQFVISTEQFYSKEYREAMPLMRVGTCFFKDKETAEYVGKNFEDWYKDFFGIE